ncbi:MAG: cell division protein FtsK [Legionellales bacterium]|nr:cell division protein FtsK [Legionellales bacterium]
MRNKNQANYRKKTPSPLPEFVSKRLFEGAFIIVLSVSVFLLLALLTYHANDPGWSRSGSLTQEIINAGGRVGAWFADFFLYLFGYMALFFPVGLTYGAWVVLRLRGQVEADSRVILVKAIGFLLILTGGCSLASLDLWLNGVTLPFTAGGILGYLMVSGLSAAFSNVGATLFSLSLFIVGLTLFTGLSWLIVTECLGKFLAISAPAILRTILNWRYTLVERIQDWRDRRRERRRQASVKQQTARATKHKPSPAKPVISQQSTPPKLSKRYERERQIPLFDSHVTDGLPPLSLLDSPSTQTQPSGYSHTELESMSRELEHRLRDFGVEIQVVAVHPGPVITRFELELAPGVKVSKITALAKDLARSLSVLSVRIVEVIPGRPTVGLELPNTQRETVCLSEVLITAQYEQARSPLSLALGVDISGHPVIVDLAKMPHLLVAGTTGSGKSVGLNAMLLSLLFKATPEEVRLILVDPKMLELSIYDDIPHLLTPVVTDTKEAASALRWAVGEMERRYRLLAALGVRNITGYNKKVAEAQKQQQPLLDPLWPAHASEPAPELTKLPYIVIVIDELADMMMVVGKKVEQLIARIAQKARAAGLHLILATQRPSVDVLTGLIKSNIPTRISFQVSSKIDSRTILDQQGAEQLLGHGDMLYLPPGTSAPVRVHGAFVDDHEVHHVADDWKQRGQPDYINGITEGMLDDAPVILPGENSPHTEDSDPLYDEAVEFVIQSRKASISAVQRRLKIGYNRAARLVEEMERTGIVSAMESNGAREVLAPVMTEN